MGKEIDGWFFILRIDVWDSLRREFRYLPAMNHKCQKLPYCKRMPFISQFVPHDDSQRHWSLCSIVGGNVLTLSEPSIDKLRCSLLVRQRGDENFISCAQNSLIIQTARWSFNQCVIEAVNCSVQALCALSLSSSERILSNWLKATSAALSRRNETHLLTSDVSLAKPNRNEHQ